MASSQANRPFLNTSEPRQNAKVVAKRRFPFMEFAVHALGLSIIAVLLWANFTEQYWKDFDPLDTQIRNELKGWQFASKMHELLMLASLSFIVFYYMRALLLGRSGIPFGLVGVTYTMSPTVLFSKPYWRGLTAQYPFGLLLGMTCLLSVILGPSSAITMIPALGWYTMKDANWNENSNYAFPGSKDSLWPAVFSNDTLDQDSNEPGPCSEDPFLLNPGCPSAGYVDIFKWWTGFIFTADHGGLTFDSGLTASRREVIFTSDKGFPDKAQNTGITATLVTELIATTMGSIGNYANYYDVANVRNVGYPRYSIASETPTYQPAVHVNCQAHPMGEDKSQYNASFPSMRSPWADDIAYQNDPFVVKSNDSIWDSFDGSNARFSWYKDSRELASSSILALAILPPVMTNSTYTGLSTTVACSIDARWLGSGAYVAPNNSTTVSSNVSDSLIRSLGVDYHEENSAKYGISETPVDIQLGWAENLNRNSTSREFLAIEFFLVLIEDLVVDDVARSATLEKSIATLLSIIISDGISRNTNSTASSLMTKTSNGSTDYTQVVEFLNQPDQRTDLGPSYVIKVALDRYGYGFALRGLSSRFAVAMLLLYAALVLGHIIYVLVMYAWKRYLGSDSWDSVGELLALTVNSTPSATLHKTSSGVQNGATWRQIVKIRETDNQHLELRFDADQHIETVESQKEGGG